MSIGEVCLIKYLRHILKYESPIPQNNISSLDIYIFTFSEAKSLDQVNLKLPRNGESQFIN